MKKGLRIDDIFEELSNHEEIKESVEISKKVSEIILKLTKARIDKGLTQKDLANITGVKQSLISNIEKAQTYPSLDIFLKLAYHLNFEFTLESNRETKEGGDTK